MVITHISVSAGVQLTQNLGVHDIGMQPVRREPMAQHWKELGRNGKAWESLGQHWEALASTLLRDVH